MLMQKRRVRDVLAEKLAALMAGRLDLNTQQKIAAKSGIGQTTVSRILRREVSATVDNIESLARAFGLHAADLFREDEVVPNGERTGYVLVPRLDVEGAQGHGRDVYEEEIVDLVRLNETWLRQFLRVSPKNLRLISGVGDSMMPTLSDGDALLVDTGIERITGDAIFAVNLFGRLLVKRVQTLSNGDLKLKSDNPAYEPVMVNATDVERLHVVGKVVWAWKGHKL